MTLPDERYRAVLYAKKFMEELAYDRKAYPRLPASVRQRAHSVLRHYPSDWDLSRAATTCPDVFQKEMHPLERMVRVYDLEEKEKQNGEKT